MKVSSSKIFLIILALLLVNQVAFSSILNIKSRVCVEIPLEETGDEDADSQIEFDKQFTQLTIPNIDVQVSNTYFSIFDACHAGPIKEIIPPPPRA